MLGVGLLLTIGTGLFVASEFALVNLDRADLESRRAAGETRLALTISALRITSTHLSSAQLGITLTTLLTGYTMEPAISNLLAPVFDAWGLSSAVSRPLAAVIGVSIATIFSMIIGELVPKNFALAVPRQTAKLVMPFQVAFTTVFRPAIAVLNGSANGVLRAVGIEPKEELSGARTAEELSSLVRRSASAGVLEEDTASLLDRSLTFARLTAAEVALLRAWIDQGLAWDEELLPSGLKSDHWAFLPVRRPAVPPTTAWSRNPVDAFVAAGHRERGLEPQQEAPRRVLIRRLAFDGVARLDPAPGRLAHAAPGGLVGE